MEDQQPATGDLIGEVPNNRPGDEETVAKPEREASEVENTSDSVASDETGNVTTENEEAKTGQTADEEADGRLRAKRPASRWHAIAVVTAAALFVGSAAFAGATIEPYLTDRATVATKLRVARTAANAITTLWTYNPDNMDKLADRAAQYLTGDFEAQYRKYIDAIVAPTKQAKVTNTTQVTGAAVESLDGPNATAIVYTNTTSTSPLTKDIPSLKYLSYRLVVKRDHARWLVARMTTITSLDLTPKL